MTTKKNIIYNSQSLLTATLEIDKGKYYWMRKLNGTRRSNQEKIS